MTQDGGTWGWNYFGGTGERGRAGFSCGVPAHVKKGGLVTREKEKIGDEQEADVLIPALSAAAGRRRQAAGA